MCVIYVLSSNNAINLETDVSEKSMCIWRLRKKNNYFLVGKSISL